MNLISAIPAIINRFRPPRQILSPSWEDRKAILKPDVNLFCWQRPQAENLSKFLEGLVTADVKPISFSTDLNDLSEKLQKNLESWQGANAEAFELFSQDVYRLCHDFISSFSQEKAGSVHLKMVTGNECTKYHVDGYIMRLFTTYHGEGTEWLPEKAVNRAALGTTNEQILKNPALVQRMAPFEVGILKGELANKLNSTRGIIHRSPQIEETNNRRIILRVDI